MKKGIESVIKLGIGVGQKNVPEAPPEATAGWQETEWRATEGKGTQYAGGSWEGSAGSLPVVYPFDEFCWITAGRVALEDEAGRRAEFGAGDAFFVPKGFTGTWITLEPSSKHFVVIES